MRENERQSSNCKHNINSEFCFASDSSITLERITTLNIKL